MLLRSILDVGALTCILYVLLEKTELILLLAGTVNIWHSWWLGAFVK